MVCKSCGAATESAASPCAACGAELQGGKPAAEVRTFFALNLVYLLLAIPFCWAIVRMLLDLESFNHGRLLLVKLGLPLAGVLAGGLYLALRGADRVRQLAGAGELQEADRAALSGRRRFARFFALSLILALFLSISLPPQISYREKALDSRARVQLETLILRQEDFLAQQGRYAVDPEALAGWQTAPEVEVRLLSADARCWQASAVHRKGRNIVIYNHCGGAGEQRFSRQRR